MNPRTAYVMKQDRLKTRLAIPMSTVVETVKAVSGMTLDFNSACDVFFEWIRQVSHGSTADLRGWLLASATDEPTLPILRFEVERFLQRVEKMLSETGATALSPEHFEFLDPDGGKWRRYPSTSARTNYGGHHYHAYDIDRRKRQNKRALLARAGL